MAPSGGSRRIADPSSDPATIAENAIASTLFAIAT
jgi:hypothetical protein